jgi:hypothetical protein
MRYEDDTEIDLREIYREDVSWMEPAEDQVQYGRPLGYTTGDLVR